MTRAVSNGMLAIVTLLSGGIIAGGIALDRWQDNRRDLAEPAASNEAAVYIGDHVAALLGGERMYHPASNTFSCDDGVIPQVDVLKTDRGRYVAVIQCGKPISDVLTMLGSECRPIVTLNVFADGWRSAAWCPSPNEKE